MGNEVEKFDPSKLMEGIKDRIKATFASMIPDDQWDAMIKKVVDDYFNSRSENWHEKRRTSNFEDLAYNLLQEETKSRIAAFLKTDGFVTDTWKSFGPPVITEKVKKMFIENSGEIFMNVLGGTFQAMMQQYHAQLQQTKY